ncbi:MAG: TonB-dependent receptor [Verrucomicrobium sp.]|nr:TonB-dependent receptor [Verrucomicrobium sp.]
MPREILSTHQKALQINLDPKKYGTFAEIGAGQEVARWFFRVGAAAGTVAKSMSAYDMIFSDAIYGPCERYVSRQRLEQMLHHEFDLLIERLNEKRGNDTHFFTFADTVRARSYQGKDECHGWLGIRYQLHTHSRANEIILHVRMLDKENLLQQEALGILGVNLLHGAFYNSQGPYTLVESLLDGLTAERIEIDMIHFSGPDFAGLDNRLLSLHLVRLGLAEVAMFSPEGETLQPSEALYKKAILIERGNFRPITRINLDMLAQARAQFLQDPRNADKPVLEIAEMTMNNLLNQGQVDPKDFLERVDVLAALGKTVMISNYAEFYKLSAFLSRYTREMVGIVMGIPLMRELFRDDYYGDLEGGTLEAFGRLFKNAVRIYVYPGVDPKGERISIRNIQMPDEVRHLYLHLIHQSSIQDVQADDNAIGDLQFSSQIVAQKIKAGDPSWERFVVPKVAELIKQHGYFGWNNGQVGQQISENLIGANGLPMATGLEAKVPLS